MRKDEVEILRAFFKIQAFDIEPYDNRSAY